MSARLHRWSATAAFAALAAGGPALADGPTSRYAEQPTAGLALPVTGISGEADALSVSANPAGLTWLDGWNLALAVDLGGADEADATGSGPGWGMFAGGKLLGLGWGLGLEFLSPPRVVLDPDPGSPTRFTWATSLPLGRASLGLAWHHFFDEIGGPMRGVDTFDAGLSARIGAYLAAGLALRDVGQPQIAGVPVERRYELEVAGRPTGTDRLELGLGGRVGEIRTDFTDGSDIDGWLRASVRVARGLYLHGEAETRSLFALAPSASGVDTTEARELRVTAGLEVSFGGVGTAILGTGAFDDDGDGRFAGLTMIARASEKEIPSVLAPDRRIERLEIKGSLGERELTRMIAQLDKAARDDSVAAVLLQIDDAEAGYAVFDEIRRALARVRAAGKRIYAYMVAGTTKTYFLASVADRVYVDAAGGVRLSGMFATSVYYKGLFDKAGVLAQFEKIEEFKSAPEAYTRTGPTQPAFTMHNELYDSMFEHMVQEVAAGRRAAGRSKVDAARVRVLIDNGPYTAGELEKVPDLVDGVVTPDSLTEILTRDLGNDVSIEAAPVVRASRWDYPTVAVVYIDGDIVDGKSATIPILGIQLAGGQTIAAALAAARASPAVDAIVLRISSPGGSALASELISREVFKTRGIKPIICSMGDVAASGGYFVAAGCDTILADPMTLTGSIGIFNGKFDFSALASRLGLSWTMYKRGALADMESILKPFTEDELRLMKRKLHYFYGRFIRAVAAGRAMTTAQVDQVGRGHVYTGVQALGNHLVDAYGGFGDALRLAKRRIGLSPEEEVQLLLLPRESAGLLGWILRQLAGDDDEARTSQAAQRAALEQMLPGGAARLLLEAIPGSVWAEPGVPQARLPFTIDWGD